MKKREFVAPKKALYDAWAIYDPTDGEPWWQGDDGPCLLYSRKKYAVSNAESGEIVVKVQLSVTPVKGAKPVITP